MLRSVPGLPWPRAGPSLPMPRPVGDGSPGWPLDTCPWQKPSREEKNEGRKLLLSRDARGLSPQDPGRDWLSRSSFPGAAPLPPRASPPPRAPLPRDPRALPLGEPPPPQGMEAGSLGRAHRQEPGASHSLIHSFIHLSQHCCQGTCWAGWFRDTVLPPEQSPCPQGA